MKKFLVLIGLLLSLSAYASITVEQGIDIVANKALEMVGQDLQITTADEIKEDLEVLDEEDVSELHEMGEGSTARAIKKIVKKYSAKDNFYISLDLDEHKYVVILFIVNIKDGKIKAKLLFSEDGVEIQE